VNLYLRGDEWPVDILPILTTHQVDE
jgi:hypothetical protein